ncbi:hypothetical protein LAZ67_23001249 [Cordylochernes scorpioides]|uniref:Reverse transcriptase n=1 Tax=Cordylochernes scorpioides TaxID=51811 RepID=A0ABY6LQJ8_9ARAC|nr:hypothetical protein LAZ67_23001249 [Cordylochernes scorpioides]
MQLQGPGKRIRPPSVGATDGAGLTHRLFITDRRSAYLFLVDTGAEVSVIPPPVKNVRPSHRQLFAANGSIIHTYGERHLELDLGLGRLFRWPFIIADVGVSIIGADFLRHYGLTVDLRNHRLSDPVSSLHSIGQVSPSPAVSIHLTIANSPYSRILRQFPELTSQNLVKSPPRHSVTHHIVTKGPPIAAKPRRLPTDKLAAAKKEIAFMMEKGICRPSKSPWASPLHLVPKKDGSLRPCGDYRKLNAATVPDRYPVPNIMDFASHLHAQTFQRLINEVLQGLDFAYAYIDDVLIASDSENQHVSHLQQLFGRLRDYGLTINETKCTFGQPSVKFLGFIITNAGISPDPQRVQAIKDIPIADTVGKLRHFLGMLNFYRRCLPNAASTQAPLHAKVEGRKNASCQWTPTALQAFDQCKFQLANAALLHHPFPEAPLCLTASPRQCRHLDFIGQFTTDIRHIAGCENVPADFLSRVEPISHHQPYDPKSLAEAQAVDQELQALLTSENRSSLQLEKVQIPETNISLYCDVSTAKPRPFLCRLPPRLHSRGDIEVRLASGQKAAEAARDICNVYGKGVIGERAAQKWFARFKNGDLDLEDMLRSGRSSEFDEEHLKALLKEDGRQTTRELAEKMKCSAVTISNHLQSIVFSQKLGAWVPYELNETKENRLQIAAQHLACHQHRAINNVFHAEDTPKPRIKKDPIDKVKSFSFTTTLSRMLHKSSKLPFKSSNGKFYSTRRTLRTSHHLYCSMSNHMRGTTFDDKEDLKTWLNNFFDTRPDDFWRNGINKLIEHWVEVANNNGEYKID